MPVLSSKPSPAAAVFPSSSPAPARTGTPDARLRTAHYDDLTPAQITRFREKSIARTIKQADCWLIQGAAVHSGHVQINLGSPKHPPFLRVRAHVFAWEFAHQAQVPMGQVIMHTCDQPRCVNPLHLRLGTQADNIHDSIEKGRYNTFGQQKLNGEQVREIRQRIASGERQRDIAAVFGVARTTIANIATRASWAHLDRPSSTGPQR